jgi:hypothetical protein
MFSRAPHKVPNGPNCFIGKDDKLIGKKNTHS